MIDSREGIALGECPEVDFGGIGPGFGVVDCWSDESVYGEELGGRIEGLFLVVVIRDLEGAEEVLCAFIVEDFTGLLNDNIHGLLFQGNSKNRPLELDCENDKDGTSSLVHPNIAASSHEGNNRGFFSSISANEGAQSRK